MYNSTGETGTENRDIWFVKKGHNSVKIAWKLKQIERAQLDHIIMDTFCIEELYHDTYPIANLNPSGSIHTIPGGGPTFLGGIGPPG